jgi:DNA-binding response OmpR family regulator
MTLESPMFPPRAEAAKPVYVRTDNPPEDLFKAVDMPDPADLLRVGPLELDLVNRTGRRGDRSFDLRPREFRLLEYMMQRCGQVLTRANLIVDVWNYNFVPETTILIDVQMGKLRRKVDGPDEAPMIRNVRGAGFILNATEQATVPQVRP